MGLLSSIAKIGGGIIGGAIGGPAGAQIGAGIGGAVGGALSGKSNDKALANSTNALLEAQRRALEAQTAAATEVKDLNAGGVASYNNSLSALQDRLGTTPKTASSGVDLNAYLAANPDVAAEASKTNSQLVGNNALERAADHYNRYGAAEVAAGGRSAGAQPAPTTPVEPGTYGTTANPTAPAPYVTPTYTAPADFSYSAEDYVASPGYQYRQDEARKGILASASATGALGSGAALKSLYDRGDQIAYQDFGNERAAALGIYGANLNKNRDAFTINSDNAEQQYGLNRNAYTDDRDYLTQRSDQQTANLFGLNSIGQNALGTVSNAIVGQGNAAAVAATNTGNITAQGVLARQSNNNTTTGNIAGSLQGILNGDNALAKLFKS